MMDFFQDHRLLSTLIALAIALAATVLLFILSSTADVKPRTSTSTTTTPTVEQYAPEGAADDSGSDDPGDAETPDASNDGSASAGSVAASEASQAVSESLEPGAVVESTQYVDVDGDGQMETLVLVRGEGDSRPLDWYLFEDSPDGFRKLFERQGVAQGEVRVDGPRILELEGLFMPGDAICCPSQIKTTYYVWKDGSLVVSSVERSPAGATP